MPNLKPYVKKEIMTVQQHKTALLNLEEQYKRTAIEISLTMGEHLTAVRDLLRHDKTGGFERWVEEELGWSRQSAYNHINVYKKFANCPNFGQLAIPISAISLLAENSTPADVREAIMDRAEQGERLTFKQVEQAIKAARRSRSLLDITSAATPGGAEADARTDVSTLCAFCNQSNQFIYPAGRSGLGICLDCARTAIRILSAQAQ